MMNVVIHDLSKEQFQKLSLDISENTHIIYDTGSIQNCIGCLGCWIKSPGKCVIKDRYNNMGNLLSQADNVVVISKCCYGGYSPFVKTVLERSISYLLPFFRIINNETHHKPRYKNRIHFIVYFYGEHITPQEMDTARKLVKANSINFHMDKYKVLFYETFDQLCREIETL